MLQVALEVDQVLAVVLVAILQELLIGMVVEEAEVGAQAAVVHQPDPVAQQYQFRAAHQLVIP
jgi:hypothetical protein